MNDTVYIEDDVVIGEGSVIHPNTLLFGKTSIGKGCVVEAGAVIRDSLVGDGTVVKSYSYLDEATVVDVPGLLGVWRLPRLGRMRSGAPPGCALCDQGSGANHDETKRSTFC